MTSFQDKINEAKRVSIVDFAVNNGVQVTNVSARYAKGVDHDSLMFDRQKNTYSWFSQDTNGDTINFAQDYLGIKDFNQAVETIINGKEKGDYKTVSSEPTKREPFQYYFKNSDSFNKVRSYLHEKRGIDNEIITALHNKGLLQQDVNGHAIFVWGRQGVPVGASVQGTEIDYEKNGKRGTQKYIGKNSLQDFGFNVSLGKPNKIMFFEAPIDLLSYWSENKNLKNTMLVSMDGLKERTVYNAMNYMYLSKGTLPIEGVYFGVDNDSKGHQFMDRISQRGFVVSDTGQSIAFKNMIPNDWDIPKDNIALYKEIAADNAIEWEALAAAHKSSSNLSNDFTAANGFDYDGLLSSDKLNSNSAMRSLPGELREAAAIISQNKIGDKYDWRNIFSDSTHGITSNEVLKIADKAQYYIDLYKDQGAKPVDTLTKDWNDDLIKKLNSESENKLLNNSYTNGSSTLAVKRGSAEKKNKLIAEQKEFNGAVKFFEADSPREMEFLIKNYGYNAVDKQDEHSMGPKISPKSPVQHSKREQPALVR